MTKNKKPTVLVILDGFGYSEYTEGNAVKAANLKNYDSLYESYPHTLISASGEDVGLPSGQMGNSEVGHMNIGAGRIVVPDLERINIAIEDGTFMKNEKLLNAFSNCIKTNSSLHIMGLLSDGGVHSHIDHLFVMLDMAKASGVSDIYIHCFTDGRDTGAAEGLRFITSLEEKLNTLGVGNIATVSGRFYAMDRDNNYERIQKAYDVMVCGKGKEYETATELVKASYENGILDEELVPARVKGGKPIQSGDTVIFFNFRPDRARQIVRSFIFTDEQIKETLQGQDKKESAEEPVLHLVRGEILHDLHVMGMTPYHKSFDGVVDSIYEKGTVPNNMGAYLSSLGLKQYRTAETEKYAHVTSFFNGSEEEPYPGETRVVIKSDKAQSYALAPHMKAREVTESFVKALNSNEYDFAVINFANPDMVGHTGDFNAVVEALNVVDECLGEVVRCVFEHGGRLCVTADHGNCDEMLLPGTDIISKKHSTNLVPFILVDKDRMNVKLREGGALRDIAPTLLDIMGLRAPSEFTGKTLIDK